MRVLKGILLVLAAIVVLCTAVFIAAGLLIPAERSFTNEVQIDAPAEVVWQVINDRDRYTEWQPNLTMVEVLDDKNWVEYPKDSPEPLRFTLGKDQRPSSMAFEYKMGESFNGTWYGYSTPTEKGVRLETLDAYNAKGWLTKVMVYTFFDMDKFAKDWNQRLKQRAESLNR